MMKLFSSSTPFYFVLFALVFFFPTEQEWATAAVISTTKLVTRFPHWQTFDSWDECYWTGPCFAASCEELSGGWANEEFHGDEYPYNASIRHWWVKKGPTTSNHWYQNDTYWPCNGVATGPCNDHTMNNASGGYLYAEASACQGVWFRVLTPPVRFYAQNAFISFWYFMHGVNISASPRGRLVLSMSVSGGNYQTLFNVSGEQQNDGDDPWLQFNRTLDSYFPSNLNENNTVTVQFRFSAFAGGSSEADWRADIAIDDILISQAGASGELIPYIDPLPANETTSGTTGSTVITEEGDGITDAQIAGIVVGVVGGLLLCCCLLIALVIVLLLIISPKKPQGPLPGATPEEL